MLYIIDRLTDEFSIEESKTHPFYITQIDLKTFGFLLHPTFEDKKRSQLKRKEFLRISQPNHITT